MAPAQTQTPTCSAERSTSEEQSSPPPKTAGSRRSVNRLAAAGFDVPTAEVTNDSNEMLPESRLRQVKSALQDSITKIVCASGDKFEENAASAFGAFRRSVHQIDALAQSSTEAILSDIDDATRRIVVVFLCRMVIGKRMYSKQVRITLDVLLKSSEWQATWQSSADLIETLPENWRESKPRKAEAAQEAVTPPEAEVPAVAGDEVRARIWKSLEKALTAGELEKAVSEAALASDRHRAETLASAEEVKSKTDGDCPVVAVSEGIPDRIKASLDDALAAGELVKALNAIVASTEHDGVGIESDKNASVDQSDECKFDNTREEAKPKHARTSSSATSSRPSCRRKRDMVRAFFGRALLCVL